MNILFVNYRISEYGGIERYTSRMLDLLQKRGHKTFLLVSQVECDCKNTKVIRKKMPRFLPLWINYFIFSILGIFWTNDIRKKENIDIIVSNGSALLKTDVVVAHSCHVASIIKTNKLYKLEIVGIKGFLKRLLRWVWPPNIVLVFAEWFIYKFGAKHIIAVSSGVKKELINLYKIPENKITVIPSGVDLTKFYHNKQKRVEIRNKLGIKKDEILLVFAGHEFGRKGLKFVIEALAKVMDLPLKLVVIGKENPQKYKTLAQNLGVSNKIYFIGLLKSGIEDFYSAGDIFVFPSGYEAFALVTLEAAASGLALLCTKINGTEELIKEGENGFFIKRDGDDIAEKIKKIINLQLLDKMRENSRKISEKYSWENIVDQALKVFKNVKNSINNNSNL